MCFYAQYMCKNSSECCTDKWMPSAEIPHSSCKKIKRLWLLLFWFFFLQLLYFFQYSLCLCEPTRFPLKLAGASYRALIQDYLRGTRQNKRHNEEKRYKPAFLSLTRANARQHTHTQTHSGFMRICCRLRRQHENWMHAVYQIRPEWFPQGIHHIILQTCVGEKTTRNEPLELQHELDNSGKQRNIDFWSTSYQQIILISGCAAALGSS